MRRLVGFFATFWTWLNGQLADYIGNNTALVAAALEPAIVTLATVYVMVWGYLQLTGRIEEPLVAGLKRLVTLAGSWVLGVAIHLWLYNSLIVDTFYSAPAQLAAAVIGTTDPVATLDVIWNRGGAVAGVPVEQRRRLQRRLRLRRRRRGRLGADRTAVRLHHVPGGTLERGARGAAGAWTAVRDAAAV